MEASALEEARRVLQDGLAAASLVVVLDSEPCASMQGGISSPDGELENQSGSRGPR